MSSFKSLLKIILIIGSLFASTFIILKVTGVLSIENVRYYFEQALTLSPFILFILVFSLLFADLFIAVPTLTVIILSGFFLGFPLGFLASFLGLFFAGFSGYFICRFFGGNFLNFIIKDKDKISELKEDYSKYGAIIILLSRAVPILPEVSACISGMTKMPLLKFSLAWIIVTIIYTGFGSYFGSISTLENPMPAILGGMGISAFFWISWLIFLRYKKKKK
jgi:uncharacterized membrane protein YdjX (TVP38/TMEM64 family)